MARYRKIDTKIWTDDKVRSLTDNGRLLWFCLLTNPRTTLIPGLMCITKADLMLFLAWKRRKLCKILQEIEQIGLAIYNEKAGVLFIPNAIRYNKPSNPNQIVSWIRALDDIPDCELKEKAIDVLEPFAKRFGKQIRNGYRNKPRNGYRNQDQDQEQDQEQEQDQDQQSKANDCNSTIDPSLLSDSEKIDLQRLEQLLWSRYGQIGATVAAKLSALSPFSGFEVRRGSMTNGNSWAYFAKVVESMRTEAAKLYPAAKDSEAESRAMAEQIERAEREWGKYV